MNNRTQQWLNLWNRIEGVLGVVILLVSWYFSSLAFGSVATKQQWIGMVLIVAVTALQFLFRMKGYKHKLTIRIAGITSYIFDFTTNVVGWSIFLGISLAAFQGPDPDYFTALLGIGICGFLAFLTSLLPEALITDALGIDNEDALVIIAGMFSGNAGQGHGNGGHNFRPQHQQHQQPSMGFQGHKQKMRGGPLQRPEPDDDEGEE